ncbi:hypothetical protein ABEB36_006058 [Hypothenemus hampei]|uniref:Uncharacterized protein n=1 Tax=Hypothenemus hampei TaxID=57062 RepID=A0ABD1F0F8_HYPHA
MMKEHEVIEKKRDKRNKGRDVDFSAEASQKYNANLEYITYRIQFFEESQRECTRRRVILLKFDQYIKRRRTIDKLVNRLLPATDEVRSLISATEELRKGFERRRNKCKIIQVVECRTSKCCSIYTKEIEVPPRPPRPPKENNEDMGDELARSPKDNNENMEVIEDEPAHLPEENNENRNNRRRRKRYLH